MVDVTNGKQWLRYPFQYTHVNESAEFGDVIVWNVDFIPGCVKIIPTTYISRCVMKFLSRK